MLFDLFLADLVFILNIDILIGIANYADDSTPYTSSIDVNGLIMLKWFDDNLMKSSPDKCHLLVSANDNAAIRIGNFQIENTKRKTLLGIQFASKLSFDYNLSKMCKKVSRKLYALVIVTLYINLLKRNILMNTFFN